MGPWSTGRMRLPMAAVGEPHSSRARFSETIATGRISYASGQVKSRPTTTDPPIVFMYPGETNLNMRIGGNC